MRYSHLILPALLWSSLSFGQTQKRMIPDSKTTPISRYSIDYELKNYTFIDGDSSLLNILNLEQYEYLRQQSQDVEILDPVTNETIVLFSLDKVVSRKSKRVSATQNSEL